MSCDDMKCAIEDLDERLISCKGVKIYIGRCLGMWKIKRLIGRGAYSAVYSITSAGGDTYAVKRQLGKEIEPREVGFQLRMARQGFAPMIYEVLSNQTESLIIMDSLDITMKESLDLILYASGGDPSLRDIGASAPQRSDITGGDPSLRDIDTVKMAKIQVLIEEGVKLIKALKSLNIAHRDLHLGNIMQNTKSGRWQVIDFGNAINYEAGVNDDTFYFIDDFVNTIEINPPETMGDVRSFVTKLILTLV